MFKHCKGAATVPNSALTDVLEVDCEELERFCARIAVTGQALAGFAVLVLFTREDTVYTELCNTATDYTVPEGLVVNTSGDLTTLAAGASGWIILDVIGVHRLKLQAKSGNAAGSGVTIYGGGQ